MTTNEKWLLRAIKGTALALCLLLLVSAVFPGLATYGTKALAEQDSVQPEELSAVPDGETLTLEGQQQTQSIALDTASESASSTVATSEDTVKVETSAPDSTPPQEEEPLSENPTESLPASSATPVPAAQEDGLSTETLETEGQEPEAEEPALETVEPGLETQEPTPEPEEESEWMGELIIQADTSMHLSVTPGQDFTLLLGIRFARGEECWESVQDNQGQRVECQDAAEVEAWLLPPPEVYNMEIRISQGEEGIPFTLDSLAKQQAQKLVEDGESCGYVSFPGLVVTPDAAVGSYPVSFVVSWWAPGQEEAQKVWISLSLWVEGAETEAEETGESPFFCCCMEAALWDAEQPEELVTDGNTGLHYAVVREEPEVSTGVVLLVEQEEEEGMLPVQEPEALAEDVGLEGEAAKVEEPYCPCVTESLGCAYCEALYNGEMPAEDVSCILSHGADMSLMSMPVTTTYGDGIIVFTIDELRTAIAAGNTLIYLGYNDGLDETSTTLYTGQAVNNGNITATGSGCPVPSGISVTIVGRDPNNGKRVTFTDWSVGNAYYTFYPAGTGQTITLSDMTIIGKNYYGTATGYGRANTTLILENVDYAGPQLIYNLESGSGTVLSNCNITIQNGSNNAEEVAQANNITLQGNVNIIHSSDGANANAVFYPSSTFTLTVASGANVNIQTGSYFIYGANATLNVYGAMTLTINNKTNTSASFFNSTGYYATLSIPSGGQMYYSCSSSASGVYPLTVDTSTINGALVVQRNAGSNSSYYTMKLKSGATLTIGDGAYVELSNAGGPVLCSASGTATMNLTTRAVNRYESANGVPTQVWNNADASPFTVVVNLATAANSNKVTSVTGLEGGPLGAAPYAVPLANASPVNMLNDRRVIFGSVGKVTLPHILGGSTWFAGEAPSGASMIAMEVAMQNGKAQSTLQTSAAVTCSAGTFSFQDAPFASPLRHADNRVYVQAQSGSLTYYTYADVTPGTPSIVSIPAVMDFETKALSASAQTIGRQEPDWAIEVYDPRPASDTYRLCVSIQEPLTGQATGDTLPGALVYRDGTQSKPLSAAQLPVAVKHGVDGQTGYIHQWAPDQGILVELPRFTGIAGESYTTEMLWTLVVE